MAAIYGVSTKRLNEQVKRNEDRFPADFAFQLTMAEKGEVVANCDHLRLNIHEAAIVDVLQRIMKILDPPPPPPEPPPPQIGFHVMEDAVPYRTRRRPGR